MTTSAANMSVAMFAISVYTAILFTDRLNIHVHTTKNKNLPLVPWVVLQTLLSAAGNLRIWYKPQYK